MTHGKAIGAGADRGHAARIARNDAAARIIFLVSAVFHYLGPAFAVLLFSRVDVLGVAWLRIVSAAVIFGLWRRPWRRFAALAPDDRRLIVAWAVVLAAMNCSFYLAIDRLALGTVAAIEFLPVIVLAAIGSRTARNVVTLAPAAIGVYLLTDVVLAGEPIGVAFAFINAALFAAYITLGHRVAQGGSGLGIDNAGRLHVDRRGCRHPVCRSRRHPGPAGPDSAARGGRRRDLVVGDPVRHGPAGDGPDEAVDLRLARLTAASHGNRCRYRRSGADPNRSRGRGRRARDHRRGPASRRRGALTSAGHAGLASGERGLETIQQRDLRLLDPSSRLVRRKPFDPVDLWEPLHPPGFGWPFVLERL